MARIYRLLNQRQRDLKKRVSQSMRDRGYASAKCRSLQRKIAQLQRAKRSLRHL
jgi:hypothetical protein